MEPTSEIVFTGNDGSVAPLLGEFPYTPKLDFQNMASFQPDVVIFDTLFPEWTTWQTPPTHIRLVYIMRKIRADRRQQFYSNPLFAEMDLILIPHSREEFSVEVPDYIQQKTFFVGPIIRSMNPDIQRGLCKKYEIGEEDFVITSTVGGGGMKKESASFFEIVSTVHKRLYTILPNLRHFVVLGPYSPISLEAQKGMTILRLEPEINNLFALSSLVIAEGGYNTVHEVRLAKSPVVFLPSPRKTDDQEERVRALEKKGFCAVFNEGSPEAISARILEVCLSKSRLDQMKTSYLRDHFETGNVAAAEKILELARASRTPGRFSTLKLGNAEMKIENGFREQFLEQGFAGPIRILTKQECQEALTYLYKASKPPVWPKANAVSDSYFYRLATRPEILIILRNLLGENILLWGASLVRKKPGVEHPWHSDIECSGETGRSVTVWIGLDKTNTESSLHVISFSHLSSETLQEVAYKSGKKRGDLTTEDALKWAQERDPRSRLESFSLTDGDALFLYGSLWHHSKNISAEGTRTALLLQYCTPDAKIRMPIKYEYEWPFQFSDEQPPCIVVSGTDHFGLNRTAPTPVSDSIQPCWIQGIDTLNFKRKAEGWQSGSIFKGATTTLKKLTCHASILDERTIPHDPHSHEEEELLIVLAGQVDIIRVDPSGQHRTSERMKAGSFVYHSAYQSHTICSAGPGPATYLMFKWKGEPASGNEQGLQSSTFNIWSGPEKQRNGWKRIVILNSPTLYLKKLNAHLSILEPGAGYPPHKDLYDVAIVVLSGKVETLEHQVGTRSVIFYPANELHGMKNPGDEQATYLVFEFHGK